MIKFDSTSLYSLTRTLWEASSPLFISILTMVGMMFTDRLFLSYYSLDAFTAASTMGHIYWAGCFGWVTVVSISSVIIARYNGASLFDKLGQPVWQMLYLTLVSIFFFAFIGFFGSQFLFDRSWINSYEAEYYCWNNYIAPLFVLLAALSSFYIGQKKTKIIQRLALLGTMINLCFDPIFIFGIRGFVKPMGIKGAALATALGLVAQSIILFTLFLNRENKSKFGTSNHSFDSKLFKSCIKLGIPSAIRLVFEMLGWWVFFFSVKRIGNQQVFICSVLQTLTGFFSFFTHGLEKGSAAVSGNLIGAREFERLTLLIWAGNLICIPFTILILVFLWLWPEPILDLFFNNQHINNHLIIANLENLDIAKQAITASMKLLFLYLMLDNIRVLIGSVLTSLGDTFFLMISGLVCLWLFMVIPSYFTLETLKSNIHTIFYFWILYKLVNLAVVYLRLTVIKKRISEKRYKKALI